MNDQMLKAAAEIGRRRALFETTSKLKDQLTSRLKRFDQSQPGAKPKPVPPPKPRADNVGWKEQPLGKGPA